MYVRTYVGRYVCVDISIRASYALSGIVCMYVCTYVGRYVCVDISIRASYALSGIV
jgi:hypothetical protein